MDLSVLELVIGGLPLARRTRDHWHYRCAIGPDGPTPVDQQAVADFLDYEREHGRAVSVEADDGLTDWESWTQLRHRPCPGRFTTQCCSDAYPEGCGSDLVCHGASPAVAATILRDGRLLSAVRVAGATTGAVRQSEWGEPADYFEHVMFANGRCTAPEAVAASRTLGRDLVPADLAPGYTPAVRFFFRWEELVARGDARFDGVHPVKIRGELSLADVLAAVVVHAGAARIVEEAAPAALAERVVVLGAERPSPGEWATAALHAARALA